MAGDPFIFWMEAHPVEIKGQFIPQVFTLVSETVGNRHIEAIHIDIECTLKKIRKRIPATIHIGVIVHPAG